MLSQLCCFGFAFHKIIGQPISWDLTVLLMKNQFIIVDWGTTKDG
jgi:hypothetical protein